MDALEAQVKCLELAMAQAKAESQHGNINRVVEIQTRFYNHIAGAPELVPSPEPEKKTRKPKADKAPGIFT